MSKLSQTIAYLNAKTEPSHRDMTFTYTDISKTPELKILRRKYRNRLKNKIMTIINVIELSENMVYKVHSFTDTSDAEDKFVKLIQKHLETQAVPHEILMDYIKKKCYTTVNGYRIEIVNSNLITI